VEIEPDFFQGVLPIDVVFVAGCPKVFAVPSLSFIGCISDCANHLWSNEDLLFEMNCPAVLDIDIVGDAHAHVALFEVERFLDHLVVAVVHYAEVEAEDFARTVDDLEVVYARLEVLVVCAPRRIHEIDNPLLIGPIVYVSHEALFVEPEPESFVFEAVVVHYVLLVKRIVSLVVKLALFHVAVHVIVVVSHLVSQVLFIFDQALGSQVFPLFVKKSFYSRHGKLFV